MVTFEESPASDDIIQKYYLLTAKSVALQQPGDGHFDVDLPKAFLSVSTVFEMDIPSLFQPQYTQKLDVTLPNGKRKLGDAPEPARKKRGSCFMSNLAYLISFCEEKLTYGTLSMEVNLTRPPPLPQLTRLDLAAAETRHLPPGPRRERARLHAPDRHRAVRLCIAPN